MISVYDFDNYISFLGALVKQREMKGKTRSQLATAMGCQAAYFSQVLKGKVDLTEDHLAKLGDYISFSRLETEYLLLLLRVQKAGTDTLREHLRHQASKLVRQSRKVESRLGSTQVYDNEDMKNYYSSSWQASVIHIATAIESLRTVSSIAQKLFLPESVVEYHLNQLDKYQLVIFENGKWKYNGNSIHFPSGSSQNAQFQMTRRIMAINSMSLPNSEDIHYSVVFASTTKMYGKIRERLLKLIAEMHSEVEPTPSEEIFSVSIDLFRPCNTGPE
jgi:uncharacterized protein (TIGR02147 family)